MSGVQGVSSIQQIVTQREITRAEWHLSTKPLEFAMNVIDIVSAYLACKNHMLETSVGFAIGLHRGTSFQVRSVEFSDPASIAEEMGRRDALLRGLAFKTLFLGAIWVDSTISADRLPWYASLFPVLAGYQFCKVLKNHLVAPNIVTRTVTTVETPPAPVIDSRIYSFQIEINAIPKDEAAAIGSTEENEQTPVESCIMSLMEEQAPIKKAIVAAESQQATQEEQQLLDESSAEPVACIIVNEDGEATVFEESR